MIFVIAAIAAVIGLINLLVVGLCVAAGKREPEFEQASFELVDFPGQRKTEPDGLTDLTRAA